MRDRLEALRGISASPPPKEKPRQDPDGSGQDDHTEDTQESDPFLEEIGQIRDSIRQLERLMDAIEKQHRGSLSATDIDECKASESSAKLHRQEFNASGDSIRNRLRRLSKQCAEVDKSDADAASALTKHKVVLHSCTKKFLEVARIFEQQCIRHRKAVVAQEERRIKTFKPSLSDTQVRQLVDEGVTSDVRLYSPVHSPQLLSPDAIEARRREAAGELDWMVARRAELAKIVEAVGQIQKTMADVALLVDQQGQSIDRVEEYLASASDYNARSKEELREAAERQRLREKQKFWATVYIVLAVVVVVVVAFVLIYFKLASEIMSFLYILAIAVIAFGIYKIYHLLSPSNWFGRKKKKEDSVLPF